MGVHDVSPKPGGAAPGAEKRRSQRVLLVVPVEVGWATGEGIRVQEHAETEVVGAYGALFRMKTSLPVGTQVQVRRPRIGQVANARVVYSGPRGPDGLARVAVELTAPSYDFWGIKIPPLTPSPH